MTALQLELQLLQCSVLNCKMSFAIYMVLQFTACHTLELVLISCSASLGGTHCHCSLCRDRNPSVHFIQTMFLLCQSEKGHIYMQHIRVMESCFGFQCAGYSPMAKQYFEYMFWFWLCRICHDSSTIWIYILDVCIVQCQCTESYWQLHSSAASWGSRWLCNAMQCITTTIDLSL